MHPGTLRVIQTLLPTSFLPVSKASFVAGRDSFRQSGAANCHLGRCSIRNRFSPVNRKQKKVLCT